MTEISEESKGPEISRDEIIKEEVAEIREIIQKETWYAGEREQRPVDSGEPIVINTVVKIVNNIGIDLRQRAIQRVMQRNQVSEDPAMAEKG